MLHTMLIVLHASAGVVAFTAGLFCIPLRAAGSWRFRVYAGSLLAMLVFVIAAISVTWAGLDLGSRLIFTGLSALGIYMVWRAGRAWARLRRQEPGWRPGYLDDVGFTLISLFAGFVIVAAIDLHLPTWLVVLIAAGGIAAGIHTMRQVKARLLTRGSAPHAGAHDGDQQQERIRH
jgi:hypothetical protein